MESRQSDEPLQFLSQESIFERLNSDLDLLEKRLQERAIEYVIASHTPRKKLRLDILEILPQLAVQVCPYIIEEGQVKYLTCIPRHMSCSIGVWLTHSKELQAVYKKQHRSSILLNSDEVVNTVQVTAYSGSNLNNPIQTGLILPAIDGKANQMLFLSIPVRYDGCDERVDISLDIFANNTLLRSISLAWATTKGLLP